ncbi:MAG: hypothetical protein LBO74_05105 [Candidatus Symbiothrix sp.]|jgi:hypothetical protein|nr:hypothetical protein [Candidatus Symbiothrix sp.]
MEVEILVICDNAQNYQNKMVVVGPFCVIYAESCPFTYPAFSLACRLNYNNLDESGEKIIKIDFLNEKGESFIPTIESSTTIPDSIEDSHIVGLVVGFGNVKFDSFGKYSIQVTIGDFYRELPLYVKQKFQP